jgi:PTS system mannose-specific IIA component
MIGIVVVTHLNLGQALLDAAGFIQGSPIEAAAAVSIDMKQPAAALRKNIAEVIRQVSDGNGVIVLTDMFGGTPSNLSYSFLEEGRIEVISGVNLPVLLRVDALRKDRDLASLAKEAEAYGKQSICLASGILKGSKKS